MGDIAIWLTHLNLGPANTILLVAIVWLAKKKICQHEEMYLWYVGQRAIEKKGKP